LERKTVLPFRITITGCYITAWNISKYYNSKPILHHDFLKTRKERKFITMSIMQEYEQIKKEIGEEKYNSIEKYLEVNPDLFLSDLYYKESEWNKFEEWYNKRL